MITTWYFIISILLQQPVQGPESQAIIRVGGFKDKVACETVREATTLVTNKGYSKVICQSETVKAKGAK